MGRLADVASSDVPLFDMPEARAVLADLLPTLDAVVALRGDAAELTAATRGGRIHRSVDCPSSRPLRRASTSW